jgi:hypothetical protein
MMTKRTTSVLLVMLLGGLLFTSTALTSSSQGYDLSWWTVDGGGGVLSIDGGYSLNGSIGQPDPGVLADGGYSLDGGFWGGGVLAGRIYRVYLPLVLNRFP